MNGDKDGSSAMTTTRLSGTAWGESGSCVASLFTEGGRALELRPEDLSHMIFALRAVGRVKVVKRLCKVQLRFCVACISVSASYVSVAGVRSSGVAGRKLKRRVCSGFVSKTNPSEWK
jgi:hypothetical protein